MKTLSTLAISLALLLTIAGCATNASTPTVVLTAPSPSANATPSPTTSGPTTTPATMPTASPTIPVPTQTRPASTPTIVPPVSTPTRTTGMAPIVATRISFLPGTTSTVISGTLDAGEVRGYVLAATADQVAIITSSSPNSDVQYTIYGEGDGMLLARLGSHGTSWRGVLPSTQDYELDVYSPAGARYVFNIVIPQRISFAPGAISAAVTGSIQQHETKHYLVRAMPGQTMSATVNSSTNDVLLTIYGLEDGSPLVRSASGATKWTGKLPSIQGITSQDYMVEAVGTFSAVPYSLEVTVR